MKWKVPEGVQKLTWSVIEYPNMSVIVPSVDSGAHTIEGMTCKCQPKIETDGNYHHVIHNSFEDKERINVSLKSMGL